MPTIYGPLDLVKNELRNAVAQNLGSAPAAPVKGLLYFSTADNTLYWYDGTQWIAAKAAAGAVPSDTVTTAAIGDAAVPGASTLFSRGDHKHGMPAFGVITAEPTFGTSKGDGSAATIARSDHTHGNPVHDAAAHSTIPLSALAAAAANLNIGGFLLTNVGAPVAGSDATNKTYVDNAIAGLSWKDNVRCATTANLAALSGLLTIDGITVVANDRVLVKNQTTASANGIYVAASGAWTRSTDADIEAELLNASVFVSEGTVNADTAWVMTANAPITVGSTNLPWVQFAGGGTITAGAGLTQTGNTLDVGAGSGITVAADTVAVDTTVIASRSYVDTQDALSLTTAGNGLTKTGQTVDVVGGTGITVAADLVSVDTTVIATRAYVDTAVTGVTKKYAAALTGTASPETITHNLNTRDVHVTVYNGASPYTAVEVDWDAATVNTITVRYNPQLGAGYRVVVIG